MKVSHKALEMILDNSKMHLNYIKHMYDGHIKNIMN